MNYNQVHHSRILNKDQNHRLRSSHSSTLDGRLTATKIKCRVLLLPGDQRLRETLLLDSRAIIRRHSADPFVMRPAVVVQVLVPPRKMAKCRSRRGRHLRHRRPFLAYLFPRRHFMSSPAFENAECLSIKAALWPPNRSSLMPVANTGGHPCADFSFLGPISEVPAAKAVAGVRYCRQRSYCIQHPRLSLDIRAFF